MLATKAEKDGESSPEIVLFSPREATEESKTQAWQDAQSWWKTLKTNYRLECHTNCKKSGSAEPESAGDPVALEEHQVDVARHLQAGSPILSWQVFLNVTRMTAQDNLMKNPSNSSALISKK